MMRLPPITNPAPTPRWSAPAFHGALYTGSTDVAVIRTRLFCTGPFGFGGAIGTGTGITAWLGGLDRDMPGRSTGASCSTGGGAGVPSWAYTTDANSKVA